MIWIIKEMLFLFCFFCCYCLQRVTLISRGGLMVFKKRSIKTRLKRLRDNLNFGLLEAFTEHSKLGLINDGDPAPFRGNYLFLLQRT
jgi:hypothetical protein